MPTSPRVPSTPADVRLSLSLSARLRLERLKSHYYDVVVRRNSGIFFFNATPLFYPTQKASGALEIKVVWLSGRRFRFVEAGLGCCFASEFCAD